MKFFHCFYLVVFGVACLPAFANKPVLHMPWDPLVLGNYGKYQCSQSAQSNVSHYVGSVDEYTIDIQMEYGTPVVASVGGTAYEYDTNVGYGKYVKIQHGDYYSVYAHLSSIVISDEQSVVAGQTIGYSGNTGCGSCGFHLHTGLFEGSASSSNYEVSVPSRYWVATANSRDGKSTPITDIACLYPQNNSSYYYSVNVEYSGGNEYVTCASDPDCDVTTDVPTGGANLADFAWLNVWVEDKASGKDITNVVRPNQELKARCRHINDGDDYNSNIEVKALLSDGKNVDSNPTTIGTENISSSNLDHGDTHTENFVFNAPQSSGIYNVTCDSDTDDDVTEEHESNNRFDDPYVFEVSEYPPSLCPNVDYPTCMSAILIILINPKFYRRTENEKRNLM